MIENSMASVEMTAGLVSRPQLDEVFKAPSFIYRVECIGPDGELKWEEEFRNLVTTAGKTDLVDKYFKGSGYTAAWYMGLKGSGTAAAGDTLASHGGWSELTPYSGNRPAISFGTTSSGSNTASNVAFSITSTATVAGAMIASVNSGTSGVLYSAGDFSVARTVGNGDTINVVATVSIT
jgi:hypothetical protein